MRQAYSFSGIVIGLLIGYTCLAFSQGDPEQTCRYLYEKVYLPCSEVAQEEGLQACETHAHIATEEAVRTGRLSRDQANVTDGICIIGCQMGERRQIAPYETFQSVICRLGSPKATRPKPAPAPTPPPASRAPAFVGNWSVSKKDSEIRGLPGFPSRIFSADSE